MGSTVKKLEKQTLKNGMRHSVFWVKRNEKHDEAVHLRQDTSDHSEYRGGWLIIYFTQINDAETPIAHIKQPHQCGQFIADTQSRSSNYLDFHRRQPVHGSVES